MIGIIYKMTLLPTKKIYVGQRWDISIESFLKNYWGSGVIWQKFLKHYQSKYPNVWKKLIRKEILYINKTNSQNALDVMEAYWIKKFNSFWDNGNGLGYNILPGSSYKFNCGHPYSFPEIKEKMANKLRGKKLPIETIEKMRKAALGRKHSEESKKKMSMNRIGKRSPRKGVKLSEETRKKMSLSHIGKKHTQITKHIIGERTRERNKVKQDMNCKSN